MRRFGPVLALALFVACTAHGQTVEKQGFFRYHASFGTIAGIRGITSLANGNLLITGCAFPSLGSPCYGQMFTLSAPSVSWGGGLNDPFPSLILPMPDGGVVAGGRSFIGGSGFFRVLPGRGLDPSFGTNGYVRFSDEEFSGIAGGVRTNEGRLIFTIERRGLPLQFAAWTEAGRPDSTFGTNGWASLPEGHSWGGGPHRLPDGDLLLVGTASTASDSTCALARFTPSGTLRTRFGTNGVLRFTIPTGPCRLGGSRLLADSTLLLFGGGGTSQMAFYRLRITGEPVTSFGTNGLAMLPGGRALTGAPVLDPATGRLMVPVTSSSGQMAMHTLSPTGTVLATTDIGGWDATVPGVTTTYAFSQSAAVHVGNDGTVSLGGVAYGRDGLQYYGLTWALARFRVATSSETPVTPAAGRLEVYPNPARGALRVSLPEALARHDRVRVDVVDLIGRSVHTVPDASVEAGGTVRLDASGLAPGHYLVRLSAGGAAATAPLVVAR